MGVKKFSKPCHGASFKSLIKCHIEQGANHQIIIFMCYLILFQLYFD